MWSTPKLSSLVVSASREDVIFVEAQLLHQFSVGVARFGVRNNSEMYGV